MFDLIVTGHRKPALSHGNAVPMVISWGVHLAGVAAVVLPLLFATGNLPAVPSMMAFVAAAPAPPPPAGAAPSAPRPAPSANPSAAPVEAPVEILPESGIDAGAELGVPGGVEGGVPGGVLGGVVAGLPIAVPPPPPPPPPPPAPRAPVRIGGEIQAPALISRVNPEYPDIAVKAQIEGVVILEAVVDQAGHVEDVRVLNMPRKERRRGRISGWKRGFKKAVVVVAQGQTIEMQ